MKSLITTHHFLYFLLLILTSWTLTTCNPSPSTPEKTPPDTKTTTAEIERAFDFTKAGKIALKKGFRLQKLKDGHFVVYNSNKWMFSQEGGLINLTNLDRNECQPPCQGNARCINGKCVSVQDCEEGGGCPDGTKCLQGTCVPVYGCDPECKENEFCNMGVLYAHCIRRKRMRSGMQEKRSLHLLWY